MSTGYDFFAVSTQADEVNVVRNTFLQTPMRPNEQLASSVPWFENRANRPLIPSLLCANVLWILFVSQRRCVDAGSPHGRNFLGVTHQEHAGQTTRKLFDVRFSPQECSLEWGTGQIVDVSFLSPCRGECPCCQDISAWVLGCYRWSLCSGHKGGNVTSNLARVSVATVGSPTACVLECLAAPVEEQTVNKLILLSCNVEGECWSRAASVCGEEIVNFKAVKRKLTESQLVSSFTHVNQVFAKKVESCAGCPLCGVGVRHSCL